MAINQKAFASIIVLLFLLFFSFIILENKRTDISDFIIIKQAETKKESIYLNFETNIKNTLNNCEEDPLINNLEVIKEANNFINNSDSNFFIKNIISQKEEEVNITYLTEIIKVIVYKPSRNIVVKEVHITNGFLKNKVLGYTLNTSNYKTTFLFPENYSLKKVIFC